MGSQTFEALAEKYLDIVLRGPVECMARCPLCDGEASLQFNIEKGLWVCFRCGQGGTAKRLVSLIGGSYTDPYVSVEVLQGALDHLRTINNIKGPRHLDESYLARFEGDSPDGYWEARGFAADTRRKWGMGYDSLSGRCTIAYRNPGGQVLGVIQRRLDNEFPRYIYPKGFDRSGSLYGSWEVSHGKSSTGVIVEGSTDAIRLDAAGVTNPLAQFGSSITTGQIRLLRRLGIRKVILFYDYDEAGRKAEQQALESLTGFLCYSVQWDEKKYCWTKHKCGCPQRVMDWETKHNWTTISQCPNKLFCKCGRKHGYDPGKLSDTEITTMISHPKLEGKRLSKWELKKKTGKGKKNV